MIDETRPARELRASFDAANLVVYQAFSPEIAAPAVLAGPLRPAVKRERMTWIKPSFLWMMYRSGWATKPGQERVLALTVSREGFEWALAHACLASYEPDVYASHAAWSDCLDAKPVRVQWDPERSLLLEPLGHRSIQVGVGSNAAHHYVNDWTVAIDDITPLVHEMRRLVRDGDHVSAADKLPKEQPYPLSDELRAIVGATTLTWPGG